MTPPLTRTRANGAPPAHVPAVCPLCACWMPAVPRVDWSGHVGRSALLPLLPSNLAAKMARGARGLKQGWATHARPYFRSRTCRNQRQIWFVPPLPLRAWPCRAFDHDSTTTTPTTATGSAITVQSTWPRLFLFCVCLFFSPVSPSFSPPFSHVASCSASSCKETLRHRGLSMSTKQGCLYPASQRLCFKYTPSHLIRQWGTTQAKAPSEAFADRRAAEFLPSYLVLHQITPPAWPHGTRPKDRPRLDLPIPPMTESCRATLMNPLRLHGQHMQPAFCSAASPDPPRFPKRCDSPQLITTSSSSSSRLACVPIRVAAGMLCWTHRNKPGGLPSCPFNSSPHIEEPIVKGKPRQRRPT